MAKHKTEIQTIIRDRIYSGYYWPREQLVEVKLADEMNVSRTVIREVLKELTLKGIVTSIPHKGTFVAELSYKEMMENLTLEAILEGSAAYLATTRVTQTQISELQRLLDDSKMFALQDIQLWAEYNWQFHKIINTTCGNKRLLKLIRDNVRIVKHWLVKVSLPIEIPERTAVHAKILDAITKNNPALVRELMEKHILFSANDLLARIKNSNPNLSIQMNLKKPAL